MVLDCQLDGPPPAQEPRRSSPKFIGCSEQMEIQAAKKAAKTEPDPWLVRKFAVGLVAAIFFYSYYVFVVRVCVRMVRMETSRLGDRAQGVVYLVLFHILFCMFVWSYVKAITTPPGFAKDYVPQTSRPVEKAELVEVPGYRFQGQPPPAEPNGPAVSSALDAMNEPARPSVSANGDIHTPEQARDEEESVGEFSVVRNAFNHSLPNGNPATTSPPPRSSSSGSPTRRPSTSDTTAFSSSSHAPVAPAKVAQASLPRLSRSSTIRSFLHFPPPPPGWEPPKARPIVERIPIQNPVLSEEYRYDARDGFLRPYRSHRCKHCAQVVLKMDHHCPWVGSCVGAHNYKFFYNFTQWSTFYTVFLLITLIIANTRPLGRPRPAIDGQQIAIIAVAGFFSLFTGALFAAHTQLILYNITTIEDMAFNRMKARERAALNRMLGSANWGMKKKTKKLWEAEWGRIGREGNLWWLGSMRANWEMVMGKEKLGWFLPIEARPHGDDGLSYQPNPRFSPDGLWRVRSEWPEELR